MACDRDVAAFGERAQRYDQDWRGRLHHQIADRTADLALACVPATSGYSTSGAGPLARRQRPHLAALVRAGIADEWARHPLPWAGARAAPRRRGTDLP
jgi:hypothetical protein